MSYTKRLNSRKVAVHCSRRCGNLPGHILAIRLSWRRWQTQQLDGGWRSPTSAGIPKCPRQLVMSHDDPAAADNFWTSPHAPIAVALHFSTCRRRLKTASAPERLSSSLNGCPNFVRFTPTYISFLWPPEHMVGHRQQRNVHQTAGKVSWLDGRLSSQVDTARPAYADPVT